MTDQIAKETAEKIRKLSSELGHYYGEGCYLDLETIKFISDAFIISDALRQQQESVPCGCITESAVMTGGLLLPPCAAVAGSRKIKEET